MGEDRGSYDEGSRGKRLIFMGSRWTVNLAGCERGVVKTAIALGQHQAPG